MSCILSAAALEYGRRAAAKLFAGRKGHGGGPCGKRVLTPLELETITAAAFEMGRRFELERGTR